MKPKVKHLVSKHSDVQDTDTLKTILKLLAFNNPPSVEGNFIDVVLAKT